MANQQFDPKARATPADYRKIWAVTIVFAFLLAGGITIFASMSNRSSNDPAVIATPAPATGVVPKRETTTGESIPPAEKK